MGEKPHPASEIAAPPNPMAMMKEMGLGPGLAGLVAEAKAGAMQFENDVKEAVKTIISNQRVLNVKLDKVLLLLQSGTAAQDIQG